jgi:hypothetical protein
MLPARVPGQAVTGSDETADVDAHSVAAATEGSASLGTGLSPAVREAERRMGRRGLWIGGRKIVRHPRDFWWIDYALTNHIWIVRRWLYDRGLRFMR